jgi:hypothetical protein
MTAKITAYQKKKKKKKKKKFMRRIAWASFSSPQIKVRLNTFPYRAIANMKTSSFNSTGQRDKVQ